MLNSWAAFDNTLGSKDWTTLITFKFIDITHKITACRLINDKRYLYRYNPKLDNKKKPRYDFPTNVDRI